MQYYTDKAMLNSTFEEGTLNVTNVLMYLDYDHMFNQETWGNLLLPNASTTDQSIEEFNTIEFKRYLKYVAFQAGLNGMFTVKTPDQVVTGYEDTLVKTLAEMPVYKGGDQTQSPILSLD